MCPAPPPPIIEFDTPLETDTNVHGYLACLRARMRDNPWIWRENKRRALIGFSYSEIRFPNKNIVKYLKINVIFCQSIYFSSCFFVLQHYR